MERERRDGSRAIPDPTAGAAARASTFGAYARLMLSDVPRGAPTLRPGVPDVTDLDDEPDDNDKTTIYRGQKSVACARRPLPSGMPPGMTGRSSRPAIAPSAAETAVTSLLQPTTVQLDSARPPGTPPTLRSEIRERVPVEVPAGKVAVARHDAVRRMAARLGLGLALAAIILGIVWLAHVRGGRVAILVAAADKANLEQVRVAVDGRQRCGGQPCILRLTAGKHALRAEAPGYLPNETEISVSPGSSLELSVALPKHSPVANPIRSAGR